MPYPKPFFPTSIWDGLTANVDRVTVHSNVNPNAEDWERIAAEVIAIERSLGAPESQTSDFALAVESGGIQLVDATSGNITVTLGPAADLDGFKFTIKKTDASGNTVTLDADGVETIDGQTTRILNQQYASLTIVSDGTEWYIL